MSNFISNENKAFIWQILMEADAFNNISNDKFQQIYISYENIISEIAKNTSMSLIEKNKLLMSKMSDFLKHLKDLNYKKQLNQQTQLQNVDIKIDLQKGETDYIKLVNHNKPKDISFNEQIDKPFNPSELNIKLNEIINARSYDNPNSLLNKSSDKKVAFASILETIEEETKETKDTKDTKIYTLLETILLELKKSTNKQDIIIEMLSKQKEN